MTDPKRRKSQNVLNMTPEEARAFIRKIMGPPKRQLEGQEREHAWLLIKMSSPVRESNNQRFITEEYVIGNRRYDVTYGIEETPIVEIYEKDDIL
jgi:hypothetical protein